MWYRLRYMRSHKVRALNEKRNEKRIERRLNGNIYSIKICERASARVKTSIKLLRLSVSLVLLQICRWMMILGQCCPHLQINPQQRERLRKNELNVPPYHNQYKSKASTTLRCQSHDGDNTHTDKQTLRRCTRPVENCPYGQRRRHNEIHQNRHFEWGGREQKNAVRYATTICAVLAWHECANYLLLHTFRCIDPIWTLGHPFLHERETI